MSDNSIQTPQQYLKPPTTFEEQLKLLKKRNLFIEDDSFALDVLSKINYYRLSAYLLPFKKYNSEYFKDNITFNTVFNIYEFDRKLRSLIMSAIEPIEILLKTKLAYYHAHKYGSEGYIIIGNFDNSDRQTKIISEFNEAVHFLLCKLRSCW